MGFSLNREWLWGVAAVAILAVAWLLDPASLVSKARERAFEVVSGALPRAETADNVAVIDIDRESLSRLGPWPWRRSQIAALIDKAAADGAKAIALDILLSGPDRRGPAALAGQLAETTEGAAIDMSAFPDDDITLARAISDASNVVLGIVVDDAGTDRPPLAAPVAVEGDTTGIVPRRTSGLLAPHAPFAIGSAGVGVLSFRDGILGRVAAAPLLTIAGSDVFPGFALDAVRVAEGAATFILKDNPSRIEVGSLTVPADAAAEMRLYFSPPDTWPRRTVPAWAVIEGDAPSGLAGKIVLIGSSAPEAGAFLPVAGSPLVPTVQIQAEAIDQMLAQRFLTRPRTAVWWELGGMVALGLAAVALAVWLPPGLAALAAVGLALAWVGFVVAAFLRSGYLIDPLGPPLAAIVAANATELAGFIRTRALKTAILQKFERYVPPEVVARLVREPQKLRLDGEVREVTALITDVEAFSGMTESSDPRALLRVLDAYFDRVTELIVAHGGMVDKIVGDAVLAFFNIPAPLAQHADAAVRCASAILTATDEFRRQGEAATLGFGRTRVGIETGTAIVGDVGGRRRLDYTAYGVVVNKAARFQDANKMLKSSICIGPDAVNSLRGDIALRPLGRIAMRGMHGLSEVFEPWRDEVPANLRMRYAQAVELFEKDPAASVEHFRSLANDLPHDPVIAMWLEKTAPP